MPGNLEVGNRVRLIRECDDGGPELQTEGTVVAFSDGEYLNTLVDWPDTFFDGHDGDGRCENGWWVHHSQLENLSAAPPKAFYLIGIIDKKEVVLSDQPTFDTGKEAAAFALKLSAERGYKVQPRRFTDTNNDAWKARELQRIEDGTYVALPDSWDLEPIADHFLHRSKDEPNMVAYTESPERGVLDRQTRTTPGRYLERFYPNLSDVERKRYIAMIDGPGGLLFAKTADEIEHVYTNGPRSCMYYKVGDGDIRSPVHPTRVYGDSDLQLAYLKEDTRITARALVWPERKIIGRLYGDDARLRQALESEGFMYGPDLSGARIRKIWDPRANQYILPYVDNAQTVLDPDPDDKEGWLVIDRSGNVGAGNTSGWGVSYRWCPRAQSWSLPGNFQFVHGANEEWDVENAYYECRRVLRENPSRHEYWTNEFLVEVGGQWMHKDDVEGNTFVSDYSGSTFRNSSKVIIGGGKAIDRSELRYTLYCAGNDKRYLQSDVRILDGLSYSNEFLEAHPEVVKEAEEREARRQEERRKLREQRKAETVRESSLHDLILERAMAKITDSMAMPNEFLVASSRPRSTTFTWDVADDLEI